MDRKTALLLKQAHLLIPRLERLVPDSRFQHQASGSRGALLRYAALLEENPTRTLSPSDVTAFSHAIHHAYTILERAARHGYPDILPAKRT